MVDESLNSDVQIRPVRRADGAGVVDLLVEVRTEHRHIAGDDARIVEPPERDMHSLYRGEDRLYLVMEKDGRIVGGAGFAPLAGGERGVCELQRMYVRASLRGRGLGARLLARCLDEAAARGFDACYLETMQGLSRANRLYENAGFQRLEAARGDTGHHFTDAWFWLDLRARSAP